MGNYYSHQTPASSAAPPAPVLLQGTDSVRKYTAASLLHQFRPTAYRGNILPNVGFENTTERHPEADRLLRDIQRLPMLPLNDDVLECASRTIYSVSQCEGL